MTTHVRWLILWESFLTFFSILASGVGLIGVVTPKEAGLVVLTAQALNAATIVYKTGTWNPNPQALPPPPTVVVQGQTVPPPE